MSTKEAKTPLFLRTYSKVRPTSFQKPQQSPIFPGDKPQTSGGARKWMNIPTGQSSPVSDVSDESHDSIQGKDKEQENASDQESFVSFNRHKKQRRRFSSTPLINVGNILANKPRLSTFKRVASPFQKKGLKPTNKAPHMASIHESDMESTSTDEEYPADQNKRKTVRSTRRARSVNEVGKQKVAHVRPQRKIGWPAMNFMVKGKKVIPLSMLSTPITTSNGLSSGPSSGPSSGSSGTSGTTADMDDSSDDESTTLSDSSAATLTEEVDSDENTLQADDNNEEEDEIEIMRDIPEANPLSIRGKKAQMIPKSKHISQTNADPLKLPLDCLSLDTSTSLHGGRKQVSFLLCSKDKEELPDREMGKGQVQLPHLSSKTSILKKTNNDSTDSSFSSSIVACTRKPQRMSSTPTRAAKKSKMMQMSFDVSAVHLPSYDVSDLVVQTAKETRQPIQFKLPPPVTNSFDVSAVHLPSYNVSDLVVQTPKETRQPIQDKVPTPVTTKGSHQPGEPTTDIAQHNLQTIEAFRSQKAAQCKATQMQDTPTSEDAEASLHNLLTHETPTVAAHTTPRSQLKRSSPESHVPIAPSKRRSIFPTMMNRQFQVQDVTPIPSSGERQRKRLEYQDKAVGPPECCITKLLKCSTYNSEGVVLRCVSQPPKMTYKEMQEMPTDVLEVLFS